jgi:peptide/nickel transport system permease protein
MTRYLIRRLIQTAILLVLISMLVFGILQLVPGGPFDALLADPNVSQNDIDRLNRLIGLDKPLPERYAQWLIRASIGASRGRSPSVSRSGASSPTGCRRPCC